MAAEVTRYSEIRRVLIITLIANVLVAAAKLSIGLLTRSLAMVADGFHSLLDGTSNIIGLISNALAARPADEDHPYGHRRFETLASMAIGGLLVLTAWEIIKSSVARFMEGGQPEIGPANFLAMAATIIVNAATAAYQRRAGKQLSSELLIADAENTQSDVFVSLAVLASLIPMLLGWAWIDALTALVIVVLIGRGAWRILRRSAGILVDQAALDSQEVRMVIHPIAGIQDVARVRSRGPSDDIHLDLDVNVAGPTTAEHAAAIASEIRRRLRSHFTGLTDIQVHFLPAQISPPDYALLARAEADALGLGVHEVIAAMTGDHFVLELHVEVPADQTVGRAHEQVSQLEARLQQAIPHLERIVTHIEPAYTPESVPYPTEGAHALARRALNMAQALYPQNTWHDLDIRAEADGGFALSMHCHVRAEMPLEEAHQLAEVVEAQLRAKLPALHRITIHTEPEDEG